MATKDRLQSWLHTQLETNYEAHRWGEDMFLTDNRADQFTLEELADLLAKAQAYAAAARWLVKTIKEHMAGRLSIGEAFRMGRSIFRVGRDSKRRLVNPDGFVSFLLEGGKDDLVAALRIDPGAVRITGLKAIAKDRGMDFDALWDTFFAIEDEHDALQEIPVSKAPQWAQKLSDGETGSYKR